MSATKVFSLPQLQATYNAYLERMMHLLSKRIVWSMKEGISSFSPRTQSLVEKFDNEKWTTTFRKLYKNMKILEKSGTFEPRFSETSKDLAETLEIVIVTEDDIVV